VFEPVNAEITPSNVATVVVRLVHKPSGRPVTDEAIVQTRIEMSPDGMASMASAIVPLPSPGPGVYGFKAPLRMAGHWLLYHQNRAA
jgi:YtkA-like